MINLYNQNLTTPFFFAPSLLSSFLLYCFLPTLRLCTFFVLCVLSCSVVPDSFVTPWTVARQAPLTMDFSRQEHWSGLLFPSAGIFPTHGMNPHLLHWQEDSLPLSHLAIPGCYGSLNMLACSFCCCCYFL